MFKFGLWIVGLVISGAVVAAPSEQVGHIRLEWKMSLDASGSITRLEPKPGRANKIMHSVLEAAIHSWTFEPGSVDGKPAETDTNLSVSVSLWPTADGENYSVRVDKVQTGGSFGRMSMKIAFPKHEVVLARERRQSGRLA